MKSSATCPVPAPGAPEDSLIPAAGAGDAETVESLLRAGAGPNAGDAAGQTALHHAVRAGHARTAACLLAYGADHARPDGNGQTPLAVPFINLATLHAVRQHYHRFARRR